MTPVPVISLTIEPNTAADGERLVLGLRQVTAEDPTIRVEIDQQTGHAIVFGIGELQLEIVVDRLKREFGVEATLGPPQVLYKEAMTRRADGNGRFVRQTGGRGQYGHAAIHLSPGEPGSGYVFESTITGLRIPEHFIKPVDDGIKAALAQGVLYGYPIDDVRIELYDGSYHDVDSSEMAFRIAGSMALQDAARHAAPILLEPIMRVEVRTPADYVSEVIGDLASRRAIIRSREERNGTQIVDAHVPMAQLLGYATDLRSRTRGQASYSSAFHEYQPVPNGDDDDPSSFVGAPRKPAPKIKVSAIALPEPEGPGW